MVRIEPFSGDRLKPPIILRNHFAIRVEFHPLLETGLHGNEQSYR